MDSNNMLKSLSMDSWNCIQKINHTINYINNGALCEDWEKKIIGTIQLRNLVKIGNRINGPQLSSQRTQLFIINVKEEYLSNIPY